MPESAPWPRPKACAVITGMAIPNLLAQEDAKLLPGHRHGRHEVIQGPGCVPHCRRQQVVLSLEGLRGAVEANQWQAEPANLRKEGAEQGSGQSAFHTGGRREEV